MSPLTWDFEVEVTGAAHSGDGGSLTLPGDALLHPALPEHLDCERTSCPVRGTENFYTVVLILLLHLTVIYSEQTTYDIK